jgi:hypothetical protein
MDDETERQTVNNLPVISEISKWWNQDVHTVSANPGAMTVGFM